MYPLVHKFKLETKNYSDLAPIFRSLLEVFLADSGMGGVESDVLAMLVKLNTRDLERNMKPEGFNRGEKNRLVFPILERGADIEFNVLYVMPKTAYRLSEDIERILKKAKIDYAMEECKDYLKDNLGKKHYADTPGASRSFF